jgi:hypothetical protein
MWNWVLAIFLVVLGCSSVATTDLSNEKIFGYKPNNALQKERKAKLLNEDKLGENRLLMYEDSVRILVNSQNSILSIEAPSELEPIHSQDEIKKGDSIDKVIKRLGKSFTTRNEQGAKIYTYNDLKHNLQMEYWTVDEQIQIIRFHTEIK